MRDYRNSKYSFDSIAHPDARQRVSRSSIHNPIQLNGLSSKPIQPSPTPDKPPAYHHPPLHTPKISSISKTIPVERKPYRKAALRACQVRLALLSSGSRGRMVWVMSIARLRSARWMRSREATGRFLGIKAARSSPGGLRFREATGRLLWVKAARSSPKGKRSRETACRLYRRSAAMMRVSVSTWGVGVSARSCQDGCRCHDGDEEGEG